MVAYMQAILSPTANAAFTQYYHIQVVQGTKEEGGVEMTISTCLKKKNGQLHFLGDKLYYF